MRIALDAMGSDNAPATEVAGALRACRDGDCEVLLVGDEQRLDAELGNKPGRDKVRIVHATQAITMDDSPTLALRQKKDASLLVGLRLVKNGEADAFVSAGNTGAVMMGARAVLRPIQGVSRSAIAQTLPTRQGRKLILDLGANVDCTAAQLCDFAEMGMLYAELILGIERPRVGLLNIGEELTKGTEVERAVHQKLRAAENINFVGNVEPRMFYRGEVDVTVCDGFVGNIVLKTSEAAGQYVAWLIRQELKSTWASTIGALFCLRAFKRVRRVVDPNEVSGAPLLGVNGTVIILHGSCNAKGVANAIRGAALTERSRIHEHIRRGIAELRAVKVESGNGA
jgi:glycerol-3-phosphate acyltransferase PlsX